MSKLYRPTPSEAKYFAPSIFKEDSFVTDAFTVSGLLPSSKEPEVDSYLIRQHLVKDARRQIDEIIDKDPVFHKLYLRHCGAHTLPSLGYARTKPPLPPIAYTNLEPQKSDSADTIECVRSVTSLAALNTDQRYMAPRPIVYQQTRLRTMEEGEFKEMLATKLKTYKPPPESRGTKRVKSIVNDLYAIMMQTSFIKNLQDQGRANKLSKNRRLRMKTDLEAVEYSKASPKRRGTLPPIERKYEQIKQADETKYEQIKQEGETKHGKKKRELERKYEKTKRKDERKYDKAKQEDESKCRKTKQKDAMSLRGNGRTRPPVDGKGSLEISILKSGR